MSECENMDVVAEVVKTGNMDTVDDSKPTKNSNAYRKRTSADPNSFQKKKKKVSAFPQMYPLMQLNELKPGLTYVVKSQKGPPHDPVFEVSVLVNDEKYVGWGNSKQMAKHSAAQAALLSFVQLRNTPEAVTVINQPAMTDFTMDNVRNEGCNFNKFEVLKNGTDDEVLITSSQSVSKTIASKVLPEADNRNPVTLLSEIHPGLIYNLKEDNSTSPNKRFRMIVNVDGQTFEGTGKNKQFAKSSAARSVLSNLYKISYNMDPKLDSSDDSVNAELLNFPQTLADQIAKSLMNTFQDVMSTSPEYAKWRVIAGFAMTKDPDMKDVQIITIGTGTKCISGERIGMVGSNLNDCHAEIISRRCLKDFFYTNLELLLEGEGDASIFMKRETSGFCVKQHIKFHLYISTAPCGDARIFSPHDEGLTDAVDRHPNRYSRGVLRTKIESAEGTIPVRGKQAIQTWDSILPGPERLLTMSCSDKMASWNVLGLQGSLLSYFIEPIYLDSVVLGGLFNSHHLQRALFARFESHLKDLPEMFRLNKPKMCAITNPEMRHLSKSPNFSVNWTLGLGRAEVVNAATGKTEAGQVSRLSKRSFFQRFFNIYDRLSHVETYEQPKPPLYVAFKSAVKNYRGAQEVLNTAFLDAGLGCWVKKPVEQHEFE